MYNKHEITYGVSIPYDIGERCQIKFKENFNPEEQDLSSAINGKLSNLSVVAATEDQDPLILALDMGKELGYGRMIIDCDMDKITKFKEHSGIERYLKNSAAWLSMH